MHGLLWRTYFVARGLPPYFRLLDDFTNLPEAEVRTQLGRRLLEQIKYFGDRDDALPEWREAAKAKNVEDLWRIWPTLPIVTKKDLQTRFNPREMQPRFNLVGGAAATGGSTGEPTPYFHDSEMLRACTALRMFCKQKMGWRPGIPTIGIWGSERDIGRQQTLRNRISAWLRHDFLVGGYRLNDETALRVLDLINRFEEVAIFGFTSMLEFVARTVVEKNLCPPHDKVCAAWNGGEMLSPEQREIFFQAFGHRISNFYGGRELSAMAFEPLDHDYLHVLRPLLMVEIVDDAGKPVGPSQSGRLIWTSTICRGTPFLRYDIGDLGMARAENYDAAGVKQIAELHGRSAGLLRLANGSTINALYWNHLFKDFSEVNQFQVEVWGGKRIHFNLKGAGMKPQREAELLKMVTNLLGDMPVTLSWLEQIPLTSQGKLVQVVQKEERQ